MPTIPMPHDDGLSDQRAQPERLSEVDQRVIECLSLGLVIFDRQLAIVHHNPAADFLVGDYHEIADALSARNIDASYQDWPKILREVIDTGRQQRFDQVLFRDRHHRERLLNLQCIPLTDAEDIEITGGTLVIEDVTVAVSMEKRLAVSERMAAVGKLAARVAHELNNPLDGILRYLNLSIRTVETGSSDKLMGYLQQARGGLLRMTEIIRELVEFSRSAYTAFDNAGINTVVEEAVKVMSDQAVRNSVSIICTLQDDLPAIRGPHLFQVFCNLIKNAVDAMPDGGTLTIATQIVGREVVVRFEDTGIGLPKEIDKIFEPFFTTKEAGKGTGLGLAVCKDIIEKYNGKIIPEPRRNGGSIFSILLPLESCAALHQSGVAGATRNIASPQSLAKPTRYSSPPSEEKQG